MPGMSEFELGDDSTADLVSVLELEIERTMPNYSQELAMFMQQLEADARTGDDPLPQQLCLEWKRIVSDLQLPLEWRSNSYSFRSSKVSRRAVVI